MDFVECVACFISDFLADWHVLFLRSLRKRRATLSLAARLEAPDVNPFKDIRASLNHCCSIGVDFSDCMRSNGCGTKFVLDSFVNDNNLISWLAVLAKAMHVLLQQGLINFELSSLLQSLQICNQWNRKECVSLECKRFWRVAQRPVDCSTNCTACRSKSTVNQLIWIDASCLRTVRKGAKCVCHCLMKSLIHCAGLRVLCSGWCTFDATQL